MLTVQLRLDLYINFHFKETVYGENIPRRKKKIISNLNGMLTKDLIFLILSDLTLGCGGYFFTTQ